MHTNSVRLNNFLNAKLTDTERIMLDLEARGRSYSSQTVKEIVAGTGGTNFFPFADTILSRALQYGKFGTYKRYKTAIGKFKDFNGSTKLALEEFDYSLLTRYEQYLLTKGNSVNTVTANLKVISKIVRDAVRADIITAQQNPFNKYKMRSKPTFRMYLTEAELCRIEALEFPPGSRIADHKNCFIFACNCGLGISDILQLRWDELKEGRICKVTQKTQATISVKLNNKALSVLELYKHRSEDNQFVFPLLKLNGQQPKDIHNSISSATAYLNKNLRKIATQAQITKPLSSHIARHTFATRALSKGLNILQVSYILGHKNLRESQIYAKLVPQDLDQAMDKFNE